MIFISYSHVDAKWCEELLTMAAPLTKYSGMRIFSDSEIAAGAHWPSTIRNNLDKATVAVLLVSRHFLRSRFIMDTELPYILNARNIRGLRVLWVPVSHCLYKETPLKDIQAGIPPSKPLEGMSQAGRSEALETVCNKIKAAWRDAERPRLVPGLAAKRVRRKVEDLKILARPATRRTEIFIRADNSDDWYHQGPIMPGHVGRTCNFGGDKAKAGTGFHMMAMTTDMPVPHQGRKPTKPLPRARTRSDQLRVVRV